MDQFDLRNGVFRVLYKAFLKPMFFMSDPETVHDRMVRVGNILGKSSIGQRIISLLFNYHHPMLEQTLLGIKFKNPVGLSAGFDKNAQLTDIMPYVGFGFEEVGSITGEPCEGNPKPRLWRLKKSKSLLVYYGLKNDGAEAISSKLKRKKFNFPVGISIAKTNSKETCDTQIGIEDYLKVYREFQDIGSYFTINVSCPNTFGGLPFTDPVKLDKLLAEIDSLPKSKPIFIKISPDLSLDEVDSILRVCDSHKVDGFVISNLTKSRNNINVKDKVGENGGMSGKIVEDLSNKLIDYVYGKTNRKYTIIGSGGVFNAHDAYKKIRLGASLLQIITGMIYEGPQVISDINKGLVKLLKQDKLSNISEALGLDNTYKKY